MAVYSIAFDFKPQRDTSDIIDAIKRYDHARAYDTYWFIETKEQITPTQLYNRFSEYITEKDLIVIQVLSDADTEGKLHAKTFSKTLKWLKDKLER